MKNIYLLIFILIFLYIICNGYIENFSVGCQSIKKKTPINISGSLTLPYINGCNPKPCDDCGEHGLQTGTPGNCNCFCSDGYTGDKCTIPPTDCRFDYTVVCSKYFNDERNCNSSYSQDTLDPSEHSYCKFEGKGGIGFCTNLGGSCSMYGNKCCK